MGVANYIANVLQVRRRPRRRVTTVLVDSNGAALSPDGSTVVVTRV